MALDPRIPLGVQPIQQPNMLGQYGQLIALQAAQEEMRGSRDMRKLFAGGADFDNPEFVAQGYAANPKEFQELLGKRATADKAKAEAIKSQIELRRDALSSVNTPEDYLSWHDANHTGALGEFFKSAGINPSRESIIAKLSAPGGLDKLKRESALGATKLQQELMQTERSIQSANIGAGATMRGQDLTNARAIEEREYARANPTLSQVQGENGFYLYNPRDPNSAVPLGMAPSAPPPPVAQQSPVNNMLMPSQSVQPSVNALVQPAPNQPGAPTVANANALVSQRADVNRPVTSAGGQQLRGKASSPLFESEYQKVVGKGLGESDLKLVQSAQNAVGKLQDINQTLTQLKESDAITGFGAEIIKDVDRFRAQFLSDKQAGKKVADTEILNAMLGSEVFGMIQSLGIGARGLDTPAEREYLREVMTGTIRMDKAALVKLTEIRKNVTERAIDEYNKKVEKGELNKFFEMQGTAPTKIEKPATVAPDNTIESLKQSGLWQYMTPEDKKLWQK